MDVTSCIVLFKVLIVVVLRVYRVIFGHQACVTPSSLHLLRHDPTFFFIVSRESVFAASRRRVYECVSLHFFVRTCAVLV